MAAILGLILGPLAMLILGSAVCKLSQALVFFQAYLLSLGTVECKLLLSLTLF